ncbi:hypothetical protein BH10ACI1_BH10ACI1_02760 [soil metagenome]
MIRFKTILVTLLCLICFHTAQGGWIKQNLNTLAWFHDVYFLNEKKGWIAGSSGTLLATGDGGKTWKKELGITDDTLRQVYFSDEFTGWLLCERNIYNRGANASSYLLKTTNGGANWDKLEFEYIKRERIVRLFFNAGKEGFAIGESGAFYKLPNDEEKWKRQGSPVRYLMLDGTFTDAKNGVIVGASGSIVFTEDAGATWKPASVFNNPTAKFNSVFFINQKNGWTAGSEGKIFQTTNSGKTWHEQISGVTNNLNGIFFVNPNKGWAVGDDGTILFTQTSGNVWISEKINLKHRLEKVVFVGGKGFAVGFGGTLLVYESDINQSQKPVLKSKK